MKAEKGTPLTYSHVRRLGDKKYLANYMPKSFDEEDTTDKYLCSTLDWIEKELSLLSHSVRPRLYPQSIHGKPETQPEYTKLLISE